MAQIALATHDEDAAANYSATASTFYQQWEQLAIDPSGRHTLLSYNWRSSYSLLYNIYPAYLLALPIIPSRLYEMQCRFYPSVSLVFGVPLDSRLVYTKSFVCFCTGATCGGGGGGGGAGAGAEGAGTRRLMVNGVARWINETGTGAPFSDLWDTVGEGGFGGRPEIVEFRARPVVGGHFSLLAVGRARKGGVV